MQKELLIFGANGALGKGVTRTLLGKDFNKIFLFDFRLDEELISGENVTGVIIDDLSKEKNVETALSNVKPGKDKRLFLYSTVGGFSGGKTLWETSAEEWQKMMDMNLKSSFLIAKYFSRLVSASSSGSACFTAAITGLDAEAGKSAYGISKSALVHLVRTLALEGRKINMSVNAIAPYIIDTPANREWMKDGDFESWMKPAEIGELIYSIFRNYNFVSGNILQLRDRFKAD